ncbi:hypothetical protein CK203_066385 [Vitis vinifera]|uniref:Uncharacterized protein n=1 Tax=Vitis vinifera TaxID=29760 RepID=A0A438G219_VITVI|nr:hypothetical protein CK203_116937 [Vitis vinifera]RVW66248.1 hypothetical protein CK203_066385 [Vitis vinifera]
MLELLNPLGFSDTHIAKLVSRYPLILQSQVDKLKLKIEYLHDNGLVGPVLHELIVSNPNILRRSLDHGSKSQYRSLTRRVPRRIGLGVSAWYRVIRKIS